MTIPEYVFLRQDKDGAVVVLLHVMPNARKTEISALHDGALKVRLQAPPVEGKANQALQEWLAGTLGIARQGVELLRGETSRRKQLRVRTEWVGRAAWAALQPPAGA